jgi:hypothetical protein
LARFSVAPNGRIDAVWLDTRNAANNINSQLFYSYSLDGGINWSLNVAISNSFNPYLGYPNQDKLGDYIAIVSDNEGSNVAYAATFNGEEDIYYVRIAPSIAVTDFNSDTRPDFLLSNPITHQTVIWYMNNNVHVTGATGPKLPLGWSVVGVAGFNGDGHPDYLLFNANTHATAIWYMNNNVHVSGNSGPTLPIGWDLLGLADFDGNGRPDYLLYNSTTHQTAIWYMNNNVRIGSAFGPTLPPGWTLAAP